MAEKLKARQQQRTLDQEPRDQAGLTKSEGEAGQGNKRSMKGSREEIKASPEEASRGRMRKCGQSRGRGKASLEDKRQKQERHRPRKKNT